MFVEYITKLPEETIELGKKLALRLKGGDVILLYGELGSGKTHFIKGIAEGLGIKMTVKSPTYAYVSRYPIGAPIGAPMGAPIGAPREHQLVFYHYDLYRLAVGGDMASLGYEETIHDPKAINAVEWADRLAENVPGQYIKIDLEGSGNKRTIRIEFIDRSIPNKNVVHQLYEEWATPGHVRAHIEQVKNVAMQVAQAFVDKGEIINLNLLCAASMLHDISRVCDFRTMEREKFKEDVTDEKWEKWQKCRIDYKGMHHADIACDQLKKLGFPEVAEVVRAHKSVNIVDEPNSYDTLEKKILYYADKRVKHDEIVDLKERFRDGWERYGKYDDKKTRQLFEEVEKHTYELEKQLFGGLDIRPGDIK